MTSAQAVLNWLTTPLSGADSAELPPWVYWHARLMALGWSVLLPLGMLVARFFKVMPGQDWPNEVERLTWWRAHLALQISGVVIMSLGLAMILGRAFLSTAAAGFHHALGWIIVAIGWIQVLGGAVRGSKGGPTDVDMRGDHYDMTARRVVFEYVHKYAGWLAALLALVATALGLIIVDAERWIALLLGLWWLLLIGAFIAFQRAGRCIDTYQALWGPDPIHPGNRMRPIGFGIVRYQGGRKPSR
jgi:hypothetical protein